MLAVDWSGDARAAHRRIRVAEAAPGPGGSRLVDVRGGLDRDGVIAHVLALAAAGPLVAGLDFSFALPSWFAAEHGAATVDEVWSLVAARGEDWLRDCPPPFWGRPGTHRPAPDPLRPLWRDTERTSGHHPLSTFQVGGAGAVGTGSLRGMPLLARLRAAGVAVWPFDAAGAATVVEIYPREITGPVVKFDPTARRARAGADPRIAPAAVDVVAASEDAFDAAFSALALAEHVGQIAALPALDGPAALEGEIWRPDRG